MNIFLTFLFILGVTLYLKPGFKFPRVEDSNPAPPAIVETEVDSKALNGLKVKSIQAEAVMITGQAMRGGIVKVVGQDGKKYYIPFDNIMYIIED